MKRLVLAPSADRDAVDAAMCTHQWKLVNIVREQGWFSLVYAVDGGELRYVEDLRIKTRYIEIPDGDPARREEQARASLETIADDRILARAASGPTQDRVRSIYWLALIADHARTSIGPLLERAAADPTPQVRIAAIETAFTIGWPELDPILERSASGEADPQIREHATKLIQARKGGSR
jgi:hypothetical protein